MKFVRNNSIIIPENSVIEQSYGPFYDKPDQYDELNVGSGSHLRGSYTFSGIQVEKLVINKGSHIAGFGIFLEIIVDSSKYIQGPKLLFHIHFSIVHISIVFKFMKMLELPEIILFRVVQ